jgi:holin-like protein
MILLFVVMLTRTPLPPALGETADGLLRHLSLLFVPAGTGVIQHLDRFGTNAVRLVAVVVLATAITLAVTALVFEFVARWMRQFCSIRPGWAANPLPRHPWPLST